MVGDLADLCGVGTLGHGLAQLLAEVLVELVGRGEVEAADVLALGGRVVDEQRLELVVRLLGHVPDGLDAVEEALAVHVGDLLEHGAVLQVVAVDDGLLVTHAGLLALVVQEDLAADAVDALGIGVEVMVVVGSLVDGVVDDRARNLDPTDDVGVDGLELLPVDLGCHVALLRDGRVGRELLVHDILLVVAPLRQAPHAARHQDEGEADDEKDVGQDAAALLLAGRLGLVGGRDGVVAGDVARQLVTAVRVHWSWAFRFRSWV